MVSCAPSDTVGEASERAPSLHAHPCIMAEPDRDLVLDPVGQITERRLVRQRPSTRQSHPQLHHSHNADAKPFVWTKSVVHQKRLKPCFAI